MLGSEFAGPATVIDGSGQLLRYSRVHADNFWSRTRSCVDFALARVGDQSVMLKRPEPELFLMCHHTSGSYGASCGTAAQLEPCFRGASAPRFGLCQCQFREGSSQVSSKRARFN